jgi:drug/metabolite transporter (DMT)-like permease
MLSSRGLWLFAPAIFVLIWSTGWIVAKYAAPHADPLTFLSVRFVAAILLLLPVAAVARAPWPADRRLWLHGLLSGVLIHALYLGGVWWAVKHGLSAGVSGLITALQPLASAWLGPTLLGERVGPRQWAGIALGTLGVALVLSPKLAATDGLVWGAVALNVVGVLAITAGTFHQKRFLPGVDLRTLTIVQYLGALAVMLPAAYLFEPMRIVANREFALALGWSVIVLSLVATALMLTMINRGQVSRVASLIYLVPATVAVQAWLMFGETLTPLQIAGMALTAVGVWLAARQG